TVKPEGDAGGTHAPPPLAPADAPDGADSAATKAAIAARPPLIRPPLASPRGIILTHNIQPSLTRGSPFAQRLASGWAVRNFFCMGPVAPVQHRLKPREFRVAGGRVRYHAALSGYRTRPVIQRGGTAHEWRRRHRRNPQVRGNGIPLLLSPQPADRGLRRARHPSDSVPARARRRRPGGRLYPYQARQAQRRIRRPG